MWQQYMDVFIDPRNRPLLEYTGGVLLAILIAMCIYFFWLHWRKIQRLINNDPSLGRKPNIVLFFLSYIGYTLLVFICTVLLSGVPLAIAVYFGVLLASSMASLIPLFLGALGFSILFSLYCTFKFLRTKVFFGEGLLKPEEVA